MPINYILIPAVSTSGGTKMGIVIKLHLEFN